ncbi:hypothetical protein CF8_0139 [Aeromonas phage CF8]|nr:hypothetical protein CF8_0139 [Aeromonas phage CF8]
MQRTQKYHEVAELFLHHYKVTVVTVIREIDERHSIPLQMSLSGHKLPDEKINRAVESLYNCKIPNIH